MALAGHFLFLVMSAFVSRGERGGVAAQRVSRKGAKEKSQGRKGFQAKTRRSRGAKGT